MDKQISVKKVIAGTVALLLLGATFFAGMQYEDYRIKKELTSAFGLDEDSDTSDGPFEDESDDTNSAAENAVELVRDEPLEVKLSDADGKMTVTLQKVDFEEVSGTYEDQPDLTRNLVYTVKVENTGDTAIAPELSGHFESTSGKVHDFAGVMCGNELPYDEIKPGQFVEGCGTSDIPADKGKFVFDANDPSFYIDVPAA